MDDLVARNLLCDQTDHRQIFGPLLTKQMGALPQDRVKSRSREIRVYTFPIALKFDRHIGSSADTIILTSNLATSRLHEIWR